MKKDVMKESKIMKIIDAIYEKVLNGLPSFDSVIELAKSYLREDGTLKEIINSNEYNVSQNQINIKNKNIIYFFSRDNSI